MIIFWLSIVGGFLFWNLTNDRIANEQLAFETARAFFQQMVVTRKWNAGHGGVYVPISKEMQPNSYLQDPLRDLSTDQNIKLTKINPSFMTRQIAEIASRNAKGVQFHITSLNPIRPENEAAEWEKEWLVSFEHGDQEKGGFFHDDTKSFFRYMAPLVVDNNCLKCHAKQGYKEGDIRGGISVTLPHFSEKTNYIIMIGYGLSALFGIIFIVIGGTLIDKKRLLLMQSNQSLENEVEEHIKSINQLKDAKDQINTLRGIIPICMHCKGIRDDKGYWNQLEKYISEHTDAQFSHCLCEKCFEKYYPDQFDAEKT